MPNVNYRGKLLSKDPDLMTEEELSFAFEAMPLPARQEAMRRALDEELGPMAPIQIADNVTEIPVAGWSSPVRITSMPPESGVTSIPLGAPWPPLSREQVVKLHEGLVAFRGEMEASKGIRSHEDQQDMIWGAAVELDGLLVEMGIGSPPPTRTWTHEEVAKVAEEVQNLAGVTVEESLRLDALAAGFKGLVEARERMERRRAGEALQAARDVGQEQYRSMVLHQPPIAKDEPPKRNCWTCKHDFGFGHTDARYCRAMPARKRGERDSERHKAIGAWTNAQSLDATLMPPKDSDGCPGWERKP